MTGSVLDGEDVVQEPPCSPSTTPHIGCVLGNATSKSLEPNVKLLLSPRAMLVNTAGPGQKCDGYVR